MNIFLRSILLLIFLCSIVGCGTTMRSQNCSRDCSAECPCECPDDPCALRCPRPKECGPTVKQIAFIQRADIGMGTYNPKYELQQKGVQIIELGDNLIVLLPIDRFFEFNSPTIREDAYTILNHLASFLKCYRCVPLYISAHTDNVASECYNRVISDKRAQSIQTYLWIRGISFSVLRATGCGNVAPIANQVTVAGNAANRRIEIRVRRTS
jgi:outer membrane protein OmpA-like peptidoglycan-associated protein